MYREFIGGSMADFQRTQSFSTVPDTSLQVGEILEHVYDALAE